MFILLSEVVVSEDGHPVDYHLYLFIEEEFLVLEALLSVSLRIAHLFLLFGILLSNSFLLLEASEKIAHAGIAGGEVGGISAGIPGE